MAVLLATPAIAQDAFASDAARLVKALELRAGHTVADIGAGGGQLTVALAREVGPSGRVYATELNVDLLHTIRRAADSAKVTNVSVVEGHATRTNLPDSCCDALVVRFVYHHFKDPRLMNVSLRQALKPGGRLAVIDFAPDSAESADPAGRASGDRHGVTSATVVRELRDAGLDLVAVDEGTERSGFMVVVRRPSAAPSGSQPPRTEPLRVAGLLRAGASDVDVMQMAAPAPHAELSNRFVEAIRRDREWFMAYVRAAPEGKPLPYHPRLGLTETEYREMLALTDSMRLRSVGSAPLVVRATASGWRLDGDSTLSDLTNIEIDTTAGVVRTSFGEARGPTTEPATPRQKVTGPVDRLVWKRESFSNDMREGVSIEFSLGRLQASGRTLLHYAARRLAGGALAARVSLMVLMDAPSTDSTESTRHPTLDGRLLTPGVDTTYTIALRAEGPDTVGVGVQRLTRSAGPGGEQWLQLFTWTARDGSAATDSLVMDYRTLRPMSESRHTPQGSIRVTYSGARVQGVIRTTSEAASPFDTTFDRPVYSSAAFDLHARALPLPASYATEVYLFNPFPASRGLHRARMWVERSDVIWAANGMSTECWVVVGALPGSDMRIWIDKRSRRIVQIVADEGDTRFVHRR
jgi:predicted methyltransferase